MENWGSYSMSQYADFTNTTKFLETPPSPPPLCKNSLITNPSETSPITDTTTTSTFKAYSGGLGRGRGGYGGRGGRASKRNESNHNLVEEKGVEQEEDDEEGWGRLRREKKKIADSCGYEHALLTGVWAGKDKKTFSPNLVTETTENFLDKTPVSSQKNDTTESSMVSENIREETFLSPSLIREQEITAESPKVSGILFSGSDVTQREIRSKSKSGGGKRDLSRFASLVKPTLVNVQQA